MNIKRLLEKIFNPELSGVRVFAAFIAIALILNLPYITAGFNYDDLFFVSVMEENVQYDRLTGFWSVDMKDYVGFNSLWWFDPGTDAKFLRPLPSLIFAGVFNLFGRASAPVLHALSIILHGLVAFTVFVFLLRLTKKYEISLLAGFIFLICEDHSLTIGWISTATDIIAVLFINLSCISYIVYREKHRPIYLLLSLFLLVVSLLSKETAVIAPAALILYELIYTPGREDDNRSSRIKLLFENFKHWAGVFLILAAYLFVYTTGGFGARNLLYYDIFANTSDYISNAVTGFPVFLAGYLTIFPISFTLFYKTLVPAAWITGITAFVFFLLAIKPYLREKYVIFNLALFLISLLPQLSTDASERQLYYPLVSGSFLISLLVFQSAFFRKRLSPGASPPGIITRIYGNYLFIFNVIIVFVLSAYYPYSYLPSMTRPQQIVEETRRTVLEKKPDKIIYLNTRGFFFTFYAHDAYRFVFGRYPKLGILTGVPGIVHIMKTGDSSIVMRADREGWISNMFARVLRSQIYVEEGEVRKKSMFTATILKTTADKKDVLEVKFDFNFPLSDKGVLFLYTDGDSIKEWDFSTMEDGKWYLLGDTSEIIKNL